MMSVKSSCTYLELCGSISDALWEDEYRIVSGDNRGRKRSRVGSEIEIKRGKKRFPAHRTAAGVWQP